MKKCLRSARDFFNNKKKLHTLVTKISVSFKTSVWGNCTLTQINNIEKHRHRKAYGSWRATSLLTKTDLANHKKRKITETETGMET